MAFVLDSFRSVSFHCHKLQNCVEGIVRPVLFLLAFLKMASQHEKMKSVFAKADLDDSGLVSEDALSKVFSFHSHSFLFRFMSFHHGVLESTIRCYGVLEF